jgi:16S rRNA (guanine966-N2)-methyltransferase
MPGAENKKSRPGRLRIVAGKWRSRLLDIADVPGLRPTSERVRETLFNWLAPSIQGARCLDLFAGTGALGFEALSRGATSVVFVENSRRAARAIEKSAQMLGAKEAVVHHGDAAEYVRKARPARRRPPRGHVRAHR